MSWAPLTPSQPLRPLPVGWLIAPWPLYLFWRAGALWVGSLVVGELVGGQTGWITPDWAALLLLALTWVWLALAVPGHRRPLLWIAAAVLGTEWALAGPRGGTLPLPAALFAEFAAAAAAVGAIVVASVQGQADAARSAT